MRRILSVLLENESGALSRVIGLFAQRGYNIESLTVAPTDDPTLSRMTIQTVGDAKVLEQIEKQLHKLVFTISPFTTKRSLFHSCFVSGQSTKLKDSLPRQKRRATTSCAILSELAKLPNAKQIVVLQPQKPQRQSPRGWGTEGGVRASVPCQMHCAE